MTLLDFAPPASATLAGGNGVTRTVLSFRGRTLTPVPEHLHAAASALLDDGEDDEYVGLSPHNGSVKRWAARWHPTAVGGELHVGTAHSLLDERLRRRSVASRGVVLGREAFSLVPKTIEPSGSTTWEELAAEPVAASVTVYFVTPTTLRNGKRSTPWVDPGSLLSSLTARWNGVTPAEASMPNPTPQERASLWVAGVRGHTEIRTLSRQRIVPGFVGEVTYRGDDPGAWARFRALLAMAEYLGVGARTEYGFGAIRLGARGGGRPAAPPAQ